LKNIRLKPGEFDVVIKRAVFQLLKTDFEDMIDFILLKE